MVKYIHARDVYYVIYNFIPKGFVVLYSLYSFRFDSPYYLLYTSLVLWKEYRQHSRTEANV